MSAEEIVKSIIQVKIVEALNSTEDLISKLVQAALEKPVEVSYGKRVPYIDYIVEEEVKSAAKSALQEIIKEKHEEMKESVKKAINYDSVIDSVCKAIIKASEEKYRVDVIFKKSYERDDD